MDNLTKKLLCTIFWDTLYAMPNSCKWRHLVAKFISYENKALCPNQVVPLGGNVEKVCWGLKTNQFEEDRSIESSTCRKTPETCVELLERQHYLVECHNIEYVNAKQKESHEYNDIPFDDDEMTIMMI